MLISSFYSRFVPRSKDVDIARINRPFIMAKAFDATPRLVKRSVK